MPLVFAQTASRVDVIRHRRAAETDGPGENGTNGSPKTKRFGPAQARRGPGRMDAGAPEAFVRIDIAEAAHAPLVEQQRLDPRSAAAKKREKFLFARLERIQPQSAEQFLERRSIQQTHAAKSPDVVQAELAAVVQRDPHMGMKRNRVGRVVKSEPTGHAQMDEQAGALAPFSPVEFKQKKFSIAAHFGNPASRQRMQKPRRVLDEVGLPEAHPDNSSRAKRAAQAPSDRFNFGKFGHIREASRRRRLPTTDFYVGRMAKTRTGPPEPPSSLIGATTRKAPAGGSWSRLARFSRW
jgi:hypothetical protein